MSSPAAELLRALRAYLGSLEDETVRDFVAGIGWAMPARA